MPVSPFFDLMRDTLQLVIYPDLTGCCPDHEVDSGDMVVPAILFAACAVCRGGDPHALINPRPPPSPSTLVPWDIRVFIHMTL